MPLIKCFEDADARIGIWQTDESESDLRAMLTADLPYDAELARFKVAKRRLEYLGTRVLLKNLLHGQEYQVAYLESGKPYLANSNHEISFSHTQGFVAVMVHPNRPVGIDIEHCSNRVLKVMDRFVAPAELPDSKRLSENELILRLLVIWSAKESVYKLIGTEVVDFYRHLTCKLFSFESDFLVMQTVVHTHPYVRVGMKVYADFVLTWTKV